MDKNDCQRRVRQHGNDVSIVETIKVVVLKPGSEKVCEMLV
jgi:hypothetical protein